MLKVAGDSNGCPWLSEEGSEDHRYCRVEGQFFRDKENSSECPMVVTGHDGERANATEIQLYMEIFH